MNNTYRAFCIICLSILIVSCKNDTKETRDKPLTENKTETIVQKKKEPIVLTENDKKVLSSLFSKAMQTPSAKKYVSTLISAELNDLLSNKEGPFTVFAPSNEAFNNLSKKNKKVFTNVKNKNLIVLILKSHIVEGDFSSDVITNEIKKNGGEFVLTTMSGATLIASNNGKEIFIKDENGNEAVIVKRDIEASNGVLHVLNKVLGFTK